MEDFKNYLSEQNKSQNTIQTYIQNIENFKKWYKDTTGEELKKIYRPNVLDYKSYLRNIKKTKKGQTLKAETKMPRGDKKAIMEYEVPIYDIDTQKKIASILSVLDEKIEVNQKINENLEQQAQAIFKSWFVDFEPFKDGEFVNSELGQIPKGWKVDNLLNIADYTNGLAMQKFRPKENKAGIPVLKIKELRQGFCDSSSDICSENIKSDFIINDGDIIFSWSGSLMIDFWCGGKCGLNQHLFKVTSNEYDKWFYYMWTEYHLEKFIAIAKDKATTMGHIKREELKKSMVLIPD